MNVLYILSRELDHAMLRRLEKRILVDLPTYEARRAMFRHHLPPVVSSKEGGLELLSELDYDALAVVSAGLLDVAGEIWKWGLHRGEKKKKRGGGGVLQGFSFSQLLGPK